MNKCPLGNWVEVTSTSDNRFIESLQKALWNGQGKARRKRPDGSIIDISPVLVLISTGTKSLHWVTLVDFHRNDRDIFGCDAIMNTWGEQKVMTCSNLARFGHSRLYGYRYLVFNQ